MYKDKLKELRKINNTTQKEVADILKISEISYTNYENEYYIIPINHLITICNYFNVSLDFIFGFSPNNKQRYFETNEKKAGIRLKEWRKENKITQEKLAKILNTNRSVIANYERGRNYIATPFLYTICKKYNVSADYLMARI